LMSFIGIQYLGPSSNIMSLGGIAIAIGEWGCRHRLDRERARAAC
jgi:hypothetical protein